MTNCVHPTVLMQALLAPENAQSPALARFLGIQANTSPLSPEELDGACALHSSPPEELAAEMAALLRLQPFKIFGGCCGTDGSHMRALAEKAYKIKEPHSSFIFGKVFHLRNISCVNCIAVLHNRNRCAKIMVSKKRRSIACRAWKISF